MSDSKERLIEAAVRPFSENAELKHSAADFLEKRLTADAGSAAAMVARWDEVDARKRRPVWHLGLWAVVAVVSAGVAISDFAELSRVVHWGKWFAGGTFYSPMPEDCEQVVASKLSESDKLLFFGDLTKTSKSDRMEALWRSEPENPAYFSEYAGAFISENEKLPPDFFETARRIDPTNAWFTYLAATVEAKDSVKSKTRSGKKVDGKMVYDPRTWEILDQARLDHAMELVREARNQPKYMDYSAAMLRRRLPLLPQEGFIDQLDSSNCLGTVSGYSSIRLRRLGDAIAAKAWSLGESGDVPGFQEISRDGERLLHQLCSKEQGTLVDELVNKVIASALAESFASAAGKLGLEHDAARWKPVETRIAEMKKKGGGREFFVDGKVVKSGTITSGIISGGVEMVARQPETQPPLTDADLKPARLADHEFLSWVLSDVLWLVMALCVGFVAIYRLRVAVLTRRLARRMEDLLRPPDWGWIVAAGVVLPFVFVMAVNRLTPLGGRDFGVRGTALLMPAGHFLGLLLLWLILPLQIVRWRLAKRAGGLGFPQPSLLGWLAVVAAAAFVPMIGWAAILQVGGSWPYLGEVSGWSWQLWAAAVLAGVSLLWVTMLVSLALLGRAERHLYRATSSLVLVRTHAAVLLVIALGSIGFKASGRYWLKQDWMTKFDVSGPGWSAYESKVAMQMRKELRELLGFER
jgi:hypothetical protein